MQKKILYTPNAGSRASLWNLFHHCLQAELKKSFLGTERGGALTPTHTDGTEERNALSLLLSELTHVDARRTTTNDCSLFGLNSK